MHNFNNNIVIGTNYLTHYYYHKASLVAKFGMLYFTKIVFQSTFLHSRYLVKKYNIIYPLFISTSRKKK